MGSQLCFLCYILLAKGIICSPVSNANEMGSSSHSQRAAEHDSRLKTLYRLGEEDESHVAKIGDRIVLMDNGMKIFKAKKEQGSGGGHSWNKYGILTSGWRLQRDVPSSRTSDSTAKTGGDEKKQDVKKKRGDDSHSHFSPRNTVSRGSLALALAERWLPSKRQNKRTNSLHKNPRGHKTAHIPISKLKPLNGKFFRRSDNSKGSEKATNVCIREAADDKSKRMCDGLLDKAKAEASAKVNMLRQELVNLATEDADKTIGGGGGAGKPAAVSGAKNHASSNANGGVNLHGEEDPSQVSGEWDQQKQVEMVGKDFRFTSWSAGGGSVGKPKNGRQ